MRFITISMVLVWSISASAKSLTDYVNPFIGTSNFGATHPGAQYPHSLASVSPYNVAYKAGGLNKFEQDEAWNSRVYIHENQFLTGFSHVNLSGVGCPELGTLLLMPTTGKLELDAEKYGSRYSNEIAEPGYYANEIDRYNIKAEVTSTQRSGLSRFTFPDGKANIILNLGEGLSNETGGSLKIVSNREVEGHRTIGTFCYHSDDVRPIYFVAKFSQPAASFGAFKKMPKYHNVEADWVAYNDAIKPYPNYQHPISGDHIGAYFSFENPDVVDVKIGISYVSIDNARENLNKEQPTFAFNKTRKKSKKAWHKLLSRIQLKGSEANKTLFYTALYHTLIHPSIIQDVNGDYPLMINYGTGNTGGKNRYSVFSLWDTNRNVHPLLSLVYPEIQSDMVNSMVDMYQESGWLPKWELLSMETQVMVGDPAAIVIADTYLRGIQDFDVNSAYEAMLKSAQTAYNNPIRPENEDYLKLGYVPYDDEGPFDGSVATSLEYYLADYNIAKLAEALGKEQDAKQYLARALNYKQLFDSETGMLRPKNRAGDWLTPYDPELGRNFEPSTGYIEGNAWNYRFYVPHDIKGLIDLLGGQNKFSEALTATFTTNNYDMANEPDITYPFLYNYIKGQEFKTSQKVKELIAKHYTNTPEGLPGNDDVGTLSTWLIYSMMGLYPIAPGSMEYALFEPSFDNITIKLNTDYYAGKRLTLSKDTNKKASPNYLPLLNGKALEGFFIDHAKLTDGAEIRYLTK